VANEVQREATLKSKVKQATTELGDPTGKPVDDTLEALAAKLRSYGFCAIAGIEAVFAKASDGLIEEYHAVFFGTGGWADSGNGKYMGVHRLKSTEPSPDACPIAPCPIREWTRETLPEGWGDNEIGRPAYEVKAINHTMGNADGSVVVIRQEPYCAATGQSPMADGNLRAACPMRLPGSGKDAEQVAIEEWILYGGFTRDSRNGQDCTPNNTTNPAAFLAGSGNCRICNAKRSTWNDPRACSLWF